MGGIAGLLPNENPGHWIFSQKLLEVDYGLLKPPSALLVFGS
jgi:hypothetical protein